MVSISCKRCGAEHEITLAVAYEGSFSDEQNFCLECYKKEFPVQERVKHFSVWEALPDYELPGLGMVSFRPGDHVEPRYILENMEEITEAFKKKCLGDEVWYMDRLDLVGGPWAEVDLDYWW